MKRYEPIVNIGIFTNTTGTYVKVEDVEQAIDSLVGSRATFPVETEEDKAFLGGYRSALEELRLQVRNGV